jgi:hydroxymethylpyrimidine/phosphomethylpyrimidine kinase
MSKDNRVFNSQATKKKFRKEYDLKINDNTINKYFGDFVKFELLKKMGRAKYFVNPMLFAKSSDIIWKEIRRDKLVREYFELYDRPTKINPERHKLLNVKAAKELQEEQFKLQEQSNKKVLPKK